MQMNASKVGRDANPNDLQSGSASSDLGDLRIRPELCQGSDLKPENQTLTSGTLVSYLREQGFETKLERAREDLVYVEVVFPNGTVRLRVATLPSAHDAGRELHEAILQHGPGSWGIHRANLAILGPIGSVTDILSFNAMTKLSCWGVLTIAGLDDSFVVPGGYREL
jgi:hypothetical protein